MALNDTKKVQTLINVVGQQILQIRAAVQTIQDMKALYQTVNPSVVGTPLEGNLAAVNTRIAALQTEVDNAVWNGMVAAIVPSHRNNAL